MKRLDAALAEKEAEIERLRKLVDKWRPPERKDSTCQCRFCQETFPALKRAKQYLRQEDYEAMEHALMASACHEMDLAHEHGKRLEAEAEIERLRNDLQEAAKSLSTIALAKGDGLRTREQIMSYAMSRANVAWGGLPTPSDQEGE